LLLRCLVTYQRGRFQIEEIIGWPVSYAFKKARREIRFSVADPAGYNYDVGTYLNTRSKKDEVKSHLETAHARATKAEEFVAKENMKETYSNWRLIFGKYFPAYH